MSETAVKKKHGILAEFETAEELVKAAHNAYEAGFRKMDGYSPYPIEELHHALGVHKTKLPLIVLTGGILGGILGFFLQYYASVIDYPYNVGGRPLNSWPAFIPVTFEMTILGAALSAVLGMLGLNGLPKPYHPVFNIDRFEAASRDGFFLCIEARDAKYDAEKIKAHFKSWGALNVFEVES